MALPAAASLLIGAAVGRWTALHPLLIAAPLWLVLAALLVLVFAGFGSPAALAAGLLFGMIFGATGALGAFLGRLRRQHIGRVR